MDIQTPPNPHRENYLTNVMYNTPFEAKLVADLYRLCIRDGLGHFYPECARKAAYWQSVADNSTYLEPPTDCIDNSCLGCVYCEPGETDCLHTTTYTDHRMAVRCTDCGAPTGETSAWGTLFGEGTL